MKVKVGRRKVQIQVDKEDFENLKKQGWTFSVTTHGYVECIKYLGKEDEKYKYKRKYLHRLLLSTPSDMFTDHINGDRLDNRRENLRVCSPYENALNASSHKGKTSRFKGVHKHSINKSWIAQITEHGQTIHIGSYTTEEEAAAAYNEKAEEIHGEFARLNKV